MTTDDKPAPEPPYPFICTSVDDVAEVFRRSTGVPVAFVTDVPALRVALGAAPEMADILRRVVPAITAASLDGGGNYIHRPETDALGLLQAEAAGMLARIDAAKGT